MSRAVVRRSTLLLVAVVLACGSSYGSDPGRPTPAIAIQLNPTSLTLAPGERGDITISVTRTNYTGGVQFVVEGNPPAGISASFSVSSLPNGTTSTTMRLTAAATAVPGSGSLVLRATGSGVADQTATIAVTIR